MVQLKRITGELIIDGEFDTIKEALQEALKKVADLSGANLSGADLRDADLYGANLSGADLSGAYLNGANLSGADLSGANLSDAYLCGAYLCGANLRRANLRGADLRRANLNRADLSSADLSRANLPMHCKHSASIIDGKIQIGCEVRTVEEWESFLDSNEVIETPRNTPTFKQIEAVIRAYIAYLKVVG